MRVFVTGGAGFVGSNLVERLIADGHDVTAYDNLSVGSRFFLQSCEAQPGFRFIEADLLDLATLCQSIAGHDAVFHLAANSDITASRLQSDLDLRLGTIATYNVLEAMRRSNIRKIVFSSSSVIYGEPSIVPTPEDYGPLLPISLYGASKLACEGLISAFCHNFDFQAWISALQTSVAATVLTASSSTSFENWKGTHAAWKFSETESRASPICTSASASTAFYLAGTRPRANSIISTSAAQAAQGSFTSPKCCSRLSISMTQRLSAREARAAGSATFRRCGSIAQN